METTEARAPNLGPPGDFGTRLRKMRDHSLWGDYIVACRVDGLPPVEGIYLVSEVAEYGGVPRDFGMRKNS